MYLDDIIIYSKSLREHIDYIELVFQALQKAGLKIKMEKCIFAKKELKYLSFRISWDEVLADPDKIKAIVKQLSPTNQTGIRAFNGIVGFFQNLIEGYSLIIGLMTNLLKKDVSFHMETRTTAGIRNYQRKVYHSTSISLPKLRKTVPLIYRHIKRRC